MTNANNTTRTHHDGSLAFVRRALGIASDTRNHHVVTDTGFNRLAGIPVTFMSKQGFGTFNNASSFATLTDITNDLAVVVEQPSQMASSSISDGRAAAHLTLGTQPGQDNNVIEAYVTSSLVTANLGYPAAFTASGKQPGDPLNTRISGIVQDNSGQPIPAVTMRLYQANLGTHNNEQTELVPPVITDANGHFTLTGVPVGLYKLMADGKTAINGGKNYPTLESTSSLWRDKTTPWVTLAVVWKKLDKTIE